MTTEIMEKIIHTPGKVTEMTGLSIHTLRFYEQMGLIDPVARASNGHRRYTNGDIRRIEFIKKMRRTGMPLDELHHYLELHRQGDCTIGERQIMLLRQHERVQEQIDDLQEMLGFLEYKIQLFESRRDCMDDLPE